MDSFASEEQFSEYVLRMSSAWLYVSHQEVGKTYYGYVVLSTCGPKRAATPASSKA